jgi:hypothetical protein
VTRILVNFEKIEPCCFEGTMFQSFSCFAFFSTSNIVMMITNNSLVSEPTNSTSNSHLEDQGLNLLFLLELESEYTQNSLQSWNVNSMKSNINQICYKPKIITLGK